MVLYSCISVYLQPREIQFVSLEEQANHCVTNCQYGKST